MNSKIKVVYIVSLPLMFFSFYSYAEASSTTSDDIVVTATGFEQNINRSPASITVIHDYEFNKKFNRDVSDIIKNIPGVSVSGDNKNSRLDVSIRGFSALYTLFLVDGKKVSSSRDIRPGRNAVGYDQGSLPPVEAIERVEIIRGPMSTLYGSDAMGGVVNIITKKAFDYWAGELASRLALHPEKDIGNKYDNSIFVGGPLIDDRLRMKLTGDLKRYNEGKSDATEDVFGNRGSLERNGEISFILTPNDINIFELGYQRNQITISQKPGYSIPKEGEYYSFTYPHKKLYASHQFTTDQLSTDTYLQYEMTSNGDEDDAAKASSILFNNLNKYVLDSNVFSFGGEITKSKRYMPGQNLLSGSSSTSTSGYAVFVEDTWSIFKDLSLSIGGRLNKDKFYKYNFSPKLYGVWEISENLVFKGGYSSGYRSPTLTDSDPNWGGFNPGTRAEGRGIYRGNPELKPESSDSIEAGINWNDGSTNISLTIFQSNFKNEISWMAPDNSNIICDRRQGNNCVHKNKDVELIRVPINLGGVKYTGVESSISWNVLPRVSATASYSATKSLITKGESSGKTKNNEEPIHRFTLSTDWLVNDNTTIWSSSTINGHSRSRDFWIPGGNDHDEGFYVKRRNPFYHITDFGVSHTLKSNITLNASVSNIFDKKLNEPTFYSSSEYGRYLSLGLTYKW